MRKITIIIPITLIFALSIMGFTQKTTIPTQISQNFGIQKDGSFHHGIDVAVPSGKMLITKRPGVVIKSGEYGVYGLTVVLDVGNGLVVLYGHNNKLLVKKGDKVVSGQPISITGNTGNSTGSHVHVELRKDGKAINPYDYLNEK